MSVILEKRSSSYAITSEECEESDYTEGIGISMPNFRAL